jgi:ankyrin repeat protein
MTPLHFACRGGHREVVSLLLASGAKIDSREVVSLSMAMRISLRVSL